MLIKLIELILYFLTALFQNYIIDYINRLYLKPKLNKHIIALTYTFICIIETFILLNFAENPTVAIIKPSLSLLLLLIFPLTLYKGSIYQKLLAIFETISTSFLADLITSNIIFNFIHYTVGKKQLLSIYRSCIQFLCSLIHLMIICLINKILQIRIFISNNLPIYIIFILSLSILFIYDTFFVTYNALFNYIFLIISVIYTLTILYLLNFLLLLESKKLTQQNIYLISKQADILNDYYSDLSQNLNNLSELRDSYENKLKIIYNLAGQNYKPPEKPINDFKNVTSNNKIADYIITNMKMNLELMDCKYNIDLNIPQDLSIDMKDLSSLLINMFNNSLEAIEKYINETTPELKDSTIYHLEAFTNYNNNILTIRIKNIKSTSDKVKQLNNNFITTKQNKDVHGYGMQIIKHIAQKYHGSMEVEYNKNIFINTVKLKV